MSFLACTPTTWVPRHPELNSSCCLLTTDPDLSPPQVPRHPDFRLVAAMNPATDAGKRELPAALRNRFTEVWVPEPSQREDLRSLVHSYLSGIGGPAPPLDAVVDFYLAAKSEAVREGTTNCTWATKQIR